MDAQIGYIYEVIKKFYKEEKIKLSQKLDFNKKILSIFKLIFKNMQYNGS
jgi:hypothetical protein